MRRSSFHRLVDLFVGALIALTISMSAVAANDVAIAMGAAAPVASMTHDSDCQPAPPMTGCAKAALCELVCVTSALTLPPEPLHFVVLDGPREPSAWANDWLTGIASPLDPSPPRTLDIA